MSASSQQPLVGCGENGGGSTYVRVYAPNGQREEPEHVRFRREVERKQSPEREHSCVRLSISYLERIGRKDHTGEDSGLYRGANEPIEHLVRPREIRLRLGEYYRKGYFKPGAFLAVHIRRGDVGEGSSLEMIRSIAA